MFFKLLFIHYMLSIFTVANVNTGKYWILRAPVPSDSVSCLDEAKVFLAKDSCWWWLLMFLKNLRCYHLMWTSRSHFHSVVGHWWWVKLTIVGNSDLHFVNLSANHHHHQKLTNLEPMFFQVVTPSCNHLGCLDP